MATIPVQSLGDLKLAHRGIVERMFGEALVQVRDDVLARPGIKAPREVVVRMQVAPVCDDNGDLASVNVGYKVQSKIPASSTNTYNAAVMKDGFAVNDLSPENVRQGTLDLDKPIE